MLLQYYINLMQRSFHITKEDVNNIDENLFIMIYNSVRYFYFSFDVDICSHIFLLIPRKPQNLESQKKLLNTQSLWIAS